MSGKKAKRIRRAIYGDYSPRKKEYTKDQKGTIRCTGLRHDYKIAKKEEAKNG